MDALPAEMKRGGEGGGGKALSQQQDLDATALGRECWTCDCGTISGNPFAIFNCHGWPMTVQILGSAISGNSVGGAFFDIDGDGFAEETAWVDADDGLLLMDRDGDGLINDVSELFGGPGKEANDNDQHLRSAA
jgi:hypothetical protein